MALQTEKHVTKEISVKYTSSIALALIALIIIDIFISYGIFVQPFEIFSIYYYDLNELLFWFFASIIFLVFIFLRVNHAWAKYFLQKATQFILAKIFFCVIVIALDLVTDHVGLKESDIVQYTPLWSGLVIWIANVCLFSILYWLLDEKAITQREITPADIHFQFPQQQDTTTYPDWKPKFFDYVFLAFTTSTALSPTDTSVLTRSAKFYVMLQASLSLITLAVFIALGINGID